MTTPIPAWAPPLPKDQLDHFVAWHGRAGAEKMMRDYAEQYRKAWMASLKPVAYLDIEWGSLHKADICEGIKVPDFVPLYRLDDQP